MTGPPARRDARVVWCATRRPGGIATVVNTLAGSQLDSTWSIEFIATHGDGTAAARIGRFGAGGLRLAARIASRRPRLVHLHSAAHGSFVRKAVLVWLARAAGARVVLHLHSGHFEQFVASLPRALRSAVAATLCRADVVVALGETWAARIHRIAPAARVSVIANPVRLPDHTATPPPGPVRVVFLGMMEAEKGFFNLLEAWAAAIGEPGCPPARLIVAGEGDQADVRTRLDRLGLNGSVELRPWLDQDEVSDLLSTAHLLVLPSLAEGQPMSVLEAMAHGLCVVATAVGGVPEMLADGRAGVLVARGDVAALACALGAVLRDPDRRAALGRAARLRAEQVHDLEVVWRVVDDLYRTLLPGASPAGRPPVPVRWSR